MNFKITSLPAVPTDSTVAFENDAADPVPVGRVILNRLVTFHAYCYVPSKRPEHLPKNGKRQRNCYSADQESQPVHNPVIDCLHHSSLLPFSLALLHQIEEIYAGAASAIVYLPLSLFCASSC